MRNRVIDLEIFDAITGERVAHSCFDTGDFPGGAMAVGYKDGFAAAHGLESEDDSVGSQERYRLLDAKGLTRYIATIV